jgi:hypothetical protein
VGHPRASRPLLLFLSPFPFRFPLPLPFLLSVLGALEPLWLGVKNLSGDAPSTKVSQTPRRAPFEFQIAVNTDAVYSLNISLFRFSRVKISPTARLFFTFQPCK